MPLAIWPTTLSLGLTTYSERFDVGIDNGLALTTKDTTDSIFQFLVLNTKGFLCCSQQDNVG